MSRLTDKRINLYLSENKLIDKAIWDYFGTKSNKQDEIKMVLYNYITTLNRNENNTNSLRFSVDVSNSSENVTITTPKRYENNTSYDNVTERLQEVDEELKNKNMAALNSFL